MQNLDPITCTDSTIPGSGGRNRKAEPSFGRTTVDKHELQLTAHWIAVEAQGTLGAVEECSETVCSC